MQIRYDLRQSNVETSVALGCFDGIHKGHLSVLNRVKRKNLKSCVFTFNDDPQNFFSVEKTKQICSERQKNAIFSEIGIDIVYYVPFIEVHKLSSSEFVDEILVKTLHAKNVVCGFNYHFGFGGTSNAQDLKRLCEEGGICVEVVDPTLENTDLISSTRIRNLIKNGDVESANNLLGRSFSVECKFKSALEKDLIVLTFPPDIVPPKNGIYECIARTNKFSTTCTVLVENTTKETFLKMFVSLPELSFENVSQKYIELLFLRKISCFNESSC